MTHVWLRCVPSGESPSYGIWIAARRFLSQPSCVWATGHNPWMLPPLQWYCASEVRSSCSLGLFSELASNLRGSVGLAQKSGWLFITHWILQRHKDMAKLEADALGQYGKELDTEALFFTAIVVDCIINPKAHWQIWKFYRKASRRMTWNDANDIWSSRTLSVSQQTGR